MASRPQPSLLEHLDLSQVNCLNEAATHTLKGIVSQKKFNTTKEYLLSDADEQLLLNIEVRVNRRLALSSTGWSVLMAACAM